MFVSKHKLRGIAFIRQVWVFGALLAMSSFCMANNPISVFEELLYWQASQQSTSPWAYQQTSNSPPGAVYTEPNAYFRWSPGGRMGVLYQPEGFLDMTFYWTYFSTKALESIRAPQGQFFIPEFFNGFTTENVFNAAELNWHLIMNIFDVDVGHTFQPTPSMAMRPFIGLKAGTINQSIHSHWELNALNVPLYSASENLKNNFVGVGPSLGVDMVFALSRQLSLHSDVSTALMWGSWDIEDTYMRPEAFLGIIPQTTIHSHMGHRMLGSFMAQYFLGFAWAFHIHTDVVIKAGYEMQFWSNQLRLPMFQALPVHGDLTLQGGVCGISIQL